MSTRRSVVWLGEPLAADAGLVGPKAAHLARLASAHPVPAGFCLTAEAYRIAAREGGLSERLVRQVSEAYERLIEGNDHRAVAVRSSALDEDGPYASFAGQHDTHLNVVGLDAVLIAIDGTWRSLRSDAAMAYRRRHDLGVDGLALAVLVQKMVPADVAGVAFSVDPVSGRRDRIVISASWGLGESVVGGTVTPDEWTLDKETLALVDTRHADKRRMTVATPGGTREVDVPSFLRLRPSLSDEQVRSVADQARRLEAVYGWPVDVEFAYSGGMFHLLQCRPVTTLPRHESPAVAVDGGSAPPNERGAPAHPGADVGLPPPEWSEPEDTTLHWQRDVTHFPMPMTVLDGYLVDVATRGFDHGVRVYRLPFATKMRRFWAHVYYHDSDQDPAQPPAEPAPPVRDIEDAAYDLGRTWEREWLPELLEHLAWWRAFDLEAADDAALLDHLDDTLRRLERVFRLHFEIVFPLGRAKRRFTELYTELFQPASPLAPLALLQGFENLTTRAGHAAWKLRDAQPLSPEAVAALTSKDAGAAWRYLSEEPALERLRAAMLAYLEEHGRRTHYVALSAPTLLEDPTPIVKLLQDALRRPDYDPEEQRHEKAAERERVVAEAREALRGYPASVRDEFDARLAQAQVATRLNEDHNYLIDYSTTGAARLVALACGARLVASGTLAAAEDVRHLTFGEIRDALAARPRPDLRPLVAEREAEFHRFANTNVPYEFGPLPGSSEPAVPAPTAGTPIAGTPTAGTPSAGAPSASPEPPNPIPADEGAGAVTGTGRGTGTPSATRARTLTGTPGSPGVARGRARVLASMREATRFQPGEVLVAPITAQTWTPLFATAAALVTDHGGMLTHSAVVAREYGLPAVVAVGNATTTLRDGMLVEVDGDRGIVQIIEHRG